MQQHTFWLFQQLRVEVIVRSHLLCIVIVAAPVWSFVSFHFHCAQHYAGNPQLVQKQFADSQRARACVYEWVCVRARPGTAQSVVGCCARLWVKWGNVGTELEIFPCLLRRRTRYSPLSHLPGSLSFFQEHVCSAVLNRNAPCVLFHNTIHRKK